MGFVVHLKENEPGTIDAERVVPEADMFLFFKGAGPAVAAIPIVNVSHIVKE